MDPLNKSLELLDTPGILWPKFEDQEVGKRLAYIGSIKDEILNVEELSLLLLEYIRDNYPGLLAQRYGSQKKEHLYPCWRVLRETENVF